MFETVFLFYAAMRLTYPASSTGDFVLEKNNTDSKVMVQETILSEKTISMENRYSGSQFVNDVFRDNMLLTLNYMNGYVVDKNDINWENINKPTVFRFKLKPGESFAYHDQVLPQYDKNVVKTTNAHFNYADGFKSDGYLVGDGVCHLASLIFWAAKDAGLEAVSPVNHNFAVINEIPKEYGVSIYSMPNNLQKSGNENMYIHNNLNSVVEFVFIYDGDKLTLKVFRG